MFRDNLPKMRYLHYDVFTSTPFEGNQLAVFPEPGHTSTALMQTLTREMNFSESTFIFPKEGSGDIRMRIFTPASEIPMAGHPTIGTAFALADEGIIEPGRNDFVFELNVGPIPVSLEWNDGRLSFAWMTQPLPTFGAEVADRSALSAAVGIDEGDLSDHPIQIVSCGVPFLFVAIRTRAAVDAVSIERKALTRALRASGLEETPVFFFTPERVEWSGPETVYSRMLAPEFGIAEDPATGGASGPLGCFMLRHGLVTAEEARAILSLQGVAMQRPSRIHISIDSNAGAISRVRVGGQAVKVGHGEVVV